MWPGFDLASIPTVLAAIDDEGGVEAAVAFNHPSPQALGTPARVLDSDGHEIVVIGEVVDPGWLSYRAPFDLFANLGGTDTFVLISQEGEFGRESGTPEFHAMLVHEAFHRYQEDEWTPHTTRQYIDSYDFSAANLELALLENRILIAAYRADAPGDLERLARQFAAVRTTRRQRDSRVAHDEAQERTEGSASFVEHLIGEQIGHPYYMSMDHIWELEEYDRNLAVPELQHYGVKTFFSFLRFYSSGATLLVLLERLGAPDVAWQLQDGRTPARLLEHHVAPLGDLDGLVADARADHDPAGHLASAAPILAELAIHEPSPTPAMATESSSLNPVQVACLKAFGVELSDTPEIGDRIWHSSEHRRRVPARRRRLRRLSPLTPLPDPLELRHIDPIYRGQSYSNSKSVALWPKHSRNAAAFFLMNFGDLQSGGRSGRCGAIRLAPRPIAPVGARRSTPGRLSPCGCVVLPRLVWGLGRVGRRL